MKKTKLEALEARKIELEERLEVRKRAITCSPQNLGKRAQMLADLSVYSDWICVSHEIDDLHEDMARLKHLEEQKVKLEQALNAHYESSKFWPDIPDNPMVQPPAASIRMELARVSYEAAKIEQYLSALDTEILPPHKPLDGSEVPGKYYITTEPVPTLSERETVAPFRVGDHITSSFCLLNYVSTHTDNPNPSQSKAQSTS